MPAKKGNPHRPSHTGTASLDKKGYWRARLRHGDQLFTASSPDSKAEALRLVRAKHAAWLKDGRTATPADKTALGPVLDAFLERVGREKKAATKGAYGRALAHLPPALRALKVAELRPAHLDRAYADLIAAGATTGTLKKLHVVLRVALGQALRQEPDAWRNLRAVLDAVRAPRHVPAERPHAEAAQMLALVRALPEPYATITAVVAYTGLRAGEVLGLRWGDLSETAGTLRLQRQSSHDTRELEDLKHASQKRTMALHPDLLAVLAAHRKRAKYAKVDDLLFPGADYAKSGLPLHQKTVYDRIATAATALGYPKGTAAHALRHGHASLALAAGASVKDVQERLGHANLATTARYLHAAGEGDSLVARKVGEALSGR